MNRNKYIKNQIFRDGVSQRDRLLRELEPDYVAVDERDLSDLLTFVKEYGKKLNYYDNTNSINGDWSSFFPKDIDVKEMIAYINNPESFADDESKLKQLSQPHLVLLFTFLQLLRYPQQQFKALTQRYLDFYYKDVLKLTTKEEVPDKVNVIFELAEGEETHLIKQGTLLNAGQDSQGINLNYATDRDIIVNQAEVASVKTLFLDKSYISLEEIHNQDDKSDISFLNMLRWAVSSPQGAELPHFDFDLPDGFDRNNLNHLYKHIKDQKIADIFDGIKSYILNQLFFATIEDFKYCFEMHFREIEGNQDGQKPTELEWNEVYKKIEKAYKKKITIGRRNTLKEELEKSGFEKMMELALGHPNPGDSLPQMPSGNTTLDEIFENRRERVVMRYIQEELYMRVEDFQKIINIKNTKENPNGEEVYRLVEKAQTKKRNFTYPPIGKTEIKNIHASSLVDAEEGQATISKRFNTFGNITQYQQTTLGFAVTSPVLLLQEGKRTITLTFTFQGQNLNLDPSILKKKPFEIYLSSKTQWIQPQNVTSEIKNSSLKFKLELDSTLPAILPPEADESIFFINTPYPVVRIILKEISAEENSQKKVIYYQQFKSILLKKVTIKVEVKNVPSVQLRNDSSVLNPKSPFQPFGNNPKVGSGFYFFNTEICHKKLDSLDINIEWMGLPQDFGEYYKAYSATGVIKNAIANDSFQCSLKLFNNRTGEDILKEIQEKSQHIFSQKNKKLEKKREFKYQNFNNISGYSFDTSVAQTDSDDPFEQSRYFKLELQSPDFGHDLYPVVLNKVALSTDNEIKSLTVYPPYTPEVQAISLDYTASVEIDLQTSPSADEPSKIFHLHPFGYADILTHDRDNSTDKKYYLLPQYEDEGSLYIGIRNLQPLQNISIFFQMIPGSGNAELTQPQIHWSYLSNNSWQEFQDTEIISDSTNGLVDTGIIRLNPKEATNQNQLLPSGLHWLRGTVKENAAAIPDTLDIETQAVRASFVNQGNAAEHLSKPLAANSIQEFVTRNPAIKTVQQPYTSFDGKAKEDNRAFTMRVSERLRHKQRAITSWDYERQVLEKFPQIYKVKCIPSAVSPDNPSAAKVTVVVIPDISNTAPFLPLKPRAPLYLLKEIEAYLQKYTSPFVQIVVKNPRYERIQYKLNIGFRAGYDQGYYLNQLNEDIKRFLSPWAYEEQADITFGSSIHSSSVIYFIEKRPYVDYVANLKLIELDETIDIKAGDRGKLDNDNRVNQLNLAQVHYPDSILVSANQHIIKLIGKEIYDEEDFEGIGYMTIGTDFVVAENYDEKDSGGIGSMRIIGTDIEPPYFVISEKEFRSKDRD